MLRLARFLLLRVVGGRIAMALAAFGLVRSWRRRRAAARQTLPSSASGPHGRR